MKLSAEMDESNTQKRLREKLPRQVKPVDSSKPAEKKKQATNRKSFKMKLEERIRDQAPINQFAKGEIILGTIPGYAPWPAQIKNIIHDTVYIEFFGTGEM